MIKPKKSLDNIQPYDTDYYKLEWRLKLDANENIYGCSKNIISAIKNIDFEEISLYPSYGKLIDKLAVKYEVDCSNILLTNGADEALNVIINTYLDRGEELLSLYPSFSMPVLYAQNAGGKVKLIEYDEKFVFNKEKIAQNISGDTKIVYIATPNNPTGEIAKASLIASLAAIFQNVLFVVDCTYINFSIDAVFQDYIDITKTYKNTVIIKSFSKDFALAGLRLGFVTADNSVINDLKKTISPYSVNIIAIKSGIAALCDEKRIEEIKVENDKARTFLYQGLKDLGFNPYPSEGNFILCDFYDYCDFYYEKLKKNGVIVRKFQKNSPVATCLRITVPKEGGVKYIFELLKKKDLLIFDLDGVVFDVSNSYMSAIAETFKYFTGETITQDEILEVKNLGGMNCDWDATKYLLEKHGYNIDLNRVIAVFQDLFYNPKIKKENYLIDKEKLLISKEKFEKISQKYDLVVFSGRLRDEVNYSLEKFGIDKYFYYFITSDILPKNMLKPHPMGVLEIIKHCPYLSVKYLGDSVDDIISGNGANVDTIGIVSPGCDYSSMVNNFRHLGAKYILGDIDNIEIFLEDIEKTYAKND